MLFTKASILEPVGEVTNALTVPSPTNVTDLASTEKSVVDSKKTPEMNGDKIKQAVSYKTLHQDNTIFTKKTCLVRKRKWFQGEVVGLNDNYNFT